MFDNFDLVKELGLSTERLRDRGYDPNDLEKILDKVGAMNKRGNFKNLFNLVVESYLGSESRAWGRDGFADWSHALCHTFEKYGRGGKSLLDSKHNLEGCTSLIDEAVKRTIDNGEVSNVGRIVSPVLAYNLDQADLENLDQPLSYRPESLTDKRFLRVYGESLFLIAGNYRQLFTGLIRRDLNKDKKDWYGPSINFPVAKLVALLKKIGPEITDQQKEDYLNLCLFENEKSDRVTMQGVDAGIKLSESATEVVDEVCVDIDGTLVYGDEDKEKLNKGLVEKLVKLMNLGRKVTVFTGGSPKLQSERLAALGADSRLLNVKSKADYQGKAVDIVFDDTLPEIQGIKALHYFSPFVWSIKFDEKGRVPVKGDGEDGE